MELLKQELRKIWQPNIVVALVVLGVLYYLLFLNFYITRFNNGPSAQSQFDITVGWMERYGPTMEPEERAQVDEQLASELATFNTMVADLPEAAEAGIVDYESFMSFSDEMFAASRNTGNDETVQKGWELERKIMDSTNAWQLQELRSLMQAYDSRRDHPLSQDATNFSRYSPDEQARIRELEDPAREQGYLSMYLQETTTYYGKYVAVWVALSVILLLSPVFVRDRLHRVRALQWASRSGRRVVRRQFAAGMLSALALTVVNVTLYSLVFVAQGALKLADTPLYSFAHSRSTWFDGTYGQYLLVLVGLVVALGLACGALALFLSRFSTTYVGMLLKATPLFVAIGALFGSWLLDSPLYFRELVAGTGFRVPHNAEYLSVALLLIVALVLCVGDCRRVRSLELLE